MKHIPVAWIGPADSVRVHGLMFSPVGYKTPMNSRVDGINLEGPGIGTLLFMLPYDPIERADSVIIHHEFDVNGISISPGCIQHGRTNGMAISGMFALIDQVNGLHVCLMSSAVYRMNGLSIAAGNSVFELNGMQLGLFTLAKKGKGAQVGLFNKCRSGHIVQIGLWNVNSRHKRPFINW